jgi:low affinity Fe/Cu permease
VSGPVFNYSDTWQLVINTGTTVATFLMIFVLQHSQNRDATAIQAKLDELIRASAASNKLIRAEQLTEAEVEELRAERKYPSRRKAIAARGSSKSSHIGKGKA